MRILPALLCLAACDSPRGGSDPPDTQLATDLMSDGLADAVPIDAVSLDAAPLDAAPTDAAPDAAADAALIIDAGLLCAPGLPTCADRTTPAVCNEQGDGFTPRDPCPAGAACANGQCVSECVLGGKDPSYIGCTYWSVDLDNYPDPFGDPSAVPHAVVLSNPSAEAADVTVTTLANVRLPVDTIRVPPGQVRIFTFPRLDADGTGITNHSFRLEATWPIVAWQFNPLNNEGVASNDASLLLPAEFLGREYVVLSWPTVPIPPQLGLPPQHGYFTVVATSPGATRVTVIPSGLVQAGGDIPALEAGNEYAFDLQQFDVLNLEADGSSLFAIQDLTGSIVSASQPVAVFGGHEEAVVGTGCCAEHLEEQMFPVETLGQRHLAARVEPRGGGGDIWRIVAAHDGTTVLTVPPQAGADRFNLNRGEWREIDSEEDFEILGSKPILVGQYTRSQEATINFIGDPDLILAVPVSQFRADYTFLTPEDFTEDWISVVRPVDTAIVFDGVPLDADFHTFGSGDFELAWIRVDDGPHTVTGEMPFGLSLYGYSAAVSYGAPGGLDLRRAP